MTEVEDIIDFIREHLINEYEDEHLDFKEKWHENFDDLLKDIISMANSSDEQDSYIVVGVSDDFKGIGFDETSSRGKKQI